jgi:hypothetical protein
MYPGVSDRGCPAGSDRGRDGKRLAGELHGRGLSPDDAADVICQVFCIPRGAARLYVRTHPAWSPEAPAEWPRWAGPPRRRMGV